MILLRYFAFCFIHYWGPVLFVLMTPVLGEEPPVKLSGLTRTFNGLGVVPEVATHPPGLPVTLVYRDLSSTAPAGITEKVFDNIPAVLPLSYSSLNFSNGVTALGNYVKIAGSARKLESCEIVLVNWSRASQYPELAAINPEGYFHPVTVSLYQVTPSNNLTAPLVFSTQNILVPWRPEFLPDGQPYPLNGYAFKATFVFPGDIILPEQVMIMVDYDTENGGFSPLRRPGPFNQLNVALDGTPPSIGEDADADVVLRVVGETWYYPNTNWSNFNGPMARLHASSVVTKNPPVTPGTYQVTATAGATGTDGTGVGTLNILAASPHVELKESGPAGITGIVLRGMVVPNGPDTTAWFDYGTTAAYGRTARAVVAAGPAHGGKGALAQLTGLNPGTVYHYRLRAVNAEGTVQTQDATFTTLAAAPWVDWMAMEGVGPTVATVRGEVDPNGSATTVWVDYGETESFGTSVVLEGFAASDSAVHSVEVALENLAPGRPYYFRLRASNAEGENITPAGTFTTPAGAPAVALKNVEPGGSTRVVLMGTVAPNGSETVAWFDYGTTAAYGHAVPAFLQAGDGPGARGALAELKGLNPGTVYHYRLRAANAEGTVQTGDATFATPAGAPGVKWTALEGVGATVATVRGEVDPNGAAAMVWLDYGETPNYGFSASLAGFAEADSSAHIVELKLENLRPGGQYFFRLRALNKVGESVTTAGSFTTLTGLQEWRRNFFGTAASEGEAADSSDFDKDGLSNFLEYSFALDPTDGSSRALPAVQRTGTQFMVSFRQPAGVSGIVYGAEASSNPGGGWKAVPDTGGEGYHTFILPSNPDASMFLRLTVTARN